jgi:hypothetical protein
MPDTVAARLVEFCRERTGESLRTVATYDAGDLEVTYLRDNLRAEYSREQFDALIDAARGVHDPLLPLQESDQPVGVHGTTVHVFSEAIVFQFVADETTGHVVSFDWDVGTKLTDFVEECREAAWANGE